MRVLLLGATGNLGRRLIPALLHHGHSVTAYVRSTSKLHTLIPAGLFDNITICEGDALDSFAVEDALRRNDCNAVMNTAGTRIVGGEQILGKIAESVSSAAIRLGKERGEAVRAWFIGGMGSLKYPSSPAWLIQDFMPARMTQHHRETEQVLKAIVTPELEWSLLCVAFMKPRLGSEWPETPPQQHNLIATTRSPPDWQDSWIRHLPFIGEYVHIWMSILSYTTQLEDVADLLAEDFGKGSHSPFVGELVGIKERSKSKLM